MNRLRSLAFLSLSLLACTGHMEVIDGGGGDDGGSGDGNPAQECPQAAQVDPGGTCSAEGLTCPSNLLTGCTNTHYGDQSVDCTCVSGTWECSSVGGCPGPPPVPCPEAAQVAQGNGCNTDPQLSCRSLTPVPTCDGTDAGTVSCLCISNSWQCPVFGGPLCLGEAGVGEAGGWGVDGGAPDGASTD